MNYEEALEYAKSYITLKGIPIDSKEATKCIVDALEKQIPTKPNYYDGRYFCAECGDELETYLFSRCISYCNSCGKAHDWSEVE